MRKKWLALALSMAMVVGSITGCGGSDSNKDASNSCLLYTSPSPRD